MNADNTDVISLSENVLRAPNFMIHRGVA